ncbi:hypothetical protein DKB58_06675 [Capnocytophaga canimorsus]|uniref:hypothetical protein n=1 Tax=Capnocytophaga canimorsus TaxID=28188 RepID=UPI000D6E67CB|nr:hypothetical protein [Capnocytophaga canimorsus]AWL78649.1 hypothetical protein DKB58_06675 [Capnocytophaga canimorsus]
MNIGDFVKVAFEITDPLNKQGQIGQIIRIKAIDEDEAEVSVLFPEGVTGVYYDNCLIVLK